MCASAFCRHDTLNRPVRKWHTRVCQSHRSTSNGCTLTSKRKDVPPTRHVETLHENGQRHKIEKRVQSKYVHTSESRTNFDAGADQETVYKCSFDGCWYTSKNAHHIKRHYRNQHINAVNVHAHGLNPGSTLTQLSHRRSNQSAWNGARCK